MGTAANIIIDDFDGIFTAAVATAGMTATGTLGGSVTTTNWTDLGFIDPEGKIKLSFTGNAVKTRPMGMEGNLQGTVTQKHCTIEFIGLEDTVDALSKALAAQTEGSDEIPDGGDAAMTYLAMSIITTNKIYHFKKIAPAVDFEKEISDDSEARLMFKWETYVEEAATAGERQWVIMERTAA